MVAYKPAELVVINTQPACGGLAPHQIDTHVGLRIRMRRKMFGWSQERLATRVGLTFQQVQKYESGANRVSASKLWAIAQALDTSVASFFDGLEPAAAQQIGAQQAVELNAFLASSDAIDLIAAFSKVQDRTLRRHVIDLVRALSTGVAVPEADNQDC